MVILLVLNPKPALLSLSEFNTIQSAFLAFNLIKALFISLLVSKAQNVVNNAPEGKGISGWRVFDGLRNRYFLIENLMNNRYNIIHDVIYSYYRSGLDNMYDKEEEARSNILQALTQLQAFNKENPNTMFVQFFMQSKSQELIGIFKKAGIETQQKAKAILELLDVANASKYKEEIK